MNSIFSIEWKGEEPFIVIERANTVFMKEIRTIFMGTPEIAKTILEHMFEAGLHISLVVTQPDRKVGRKQNLVQSPVKEYALTKGIQVFQPANIKIDYQTILDCNPDLIVTCAYGQIVPDAILEYPKYGCVNLHGSILPKYRGAAPIQRAIWNGDTETGMTLMKMVSKMDAGPIFAVKPVIIDNDDTTTSLFKKMGQAASELLIENFDGICRVDAHYMEQDETQVTYANKITKEDEELNLSQDDSGLINQIRALLDEPGGYIKIKNKKFKILKFHYLSESVKTPYTWVGKIDSGFGLALKNGILVIEKCQMEGKPVVSGIDFYNGQGRNLVGQSVI